ncbi:MAG: site-specific integrase [Prevotellaceae bacterium]|nr:site-specific integrase [Prevotellaceae bacterium]
MSKIRFYLKDPNATKETSVFMMVNFGRHKMVRGRKKYLPLKYYIGESINPIFWNKRTNRAKETRIYPQHTTFNQRLTQIENVVQTLLTNYKYENRPIDEAQLQSALDAHIKNRSIIGIDVKLTFFMFIEQFITEAECTRSISTVRQYKNTFRLLSDFAAKVRKVDFQSIDMSFYASFKSYMDSLGYTDAYFGNQIKYIRLFMNEATERGYNDQTQFRSRKFTCPQIASDKIYLTSKEISRIRTADLLGSEKLERIRDVFVVGCHTGLRFSDLVRLQPSNFNMKEKILRIKTQKTDTVVYVPLSPETLDICKKYNFNLPRLSNSTFNVHLKEIGRKAGLTEEVEIVETKGSRKVRKIVPKYQLITSHTARRSFATNAFLARVPNLSIMQITGHSTEKAFMKYIRISGEDNARRLLQHPYFSKK